MASSTTIPTRQGQQTVLSRLQGLFPHSPQPNVGPSTLDETQITPEVPATPKFFKVRILTWNMHDSVPKGDLEELLGKVPYYKPTTASPSSFPEFPADQSHPYHLVIVAGQECPSLSGIPMGFGAGFKLIDKDHADKDRPESIRSSKKNPEESPHETLTGWTAMVEDWLCHAGACGTRLSSPTTSDISGPKPLSPRLSVTEKKGPYQMLIKERMMGIYLSVYIHRDLRSHVNGMSKSAVTAGLIGGRVGNKGGVGISLKIDNTSFLFMNCHLAAHEGKVNHRLANLAKIKSALAVEDFLASDDPRVMAEELTDKFDYTFLFGDLNFRLDISRLHADWLISRQDYAQALCFDQLRNLMANGQAFVGFSEGPIDFPPTFKYDVLRTLKRPKRHGSRLDRWRNQEKSQRLTEVEEREHDDVHEENDGDEDGDEHDDTQGENASLASSVWTSMHSRHPTEMEDEYFESSMSQTTTPGSKVSLTLAAHKAKAKWMSLLSPSTPSSPSKWLRSRQDASLLSPLRSNPSRKSTRSLAELGGFDNGDTVDGQRASSLDADERPGEKEVAMEMEEKRSLLRPPPLMTSTSTRSLANSDDEDVDHGVYDSSTKKRVPSWCDRILWKSTVIPDPEPDYFTVDQSSRGRSRMGQFFANAFRPLSGRTRRESCSSTISAANSLITNASHGDSPLPSPDISDTTVPFSRFVYSNPSATSSPLNADLTIPRNVSHAKSHDNLRTTERPTLSRRSSHDIEARRKRTSSMGSTSSKPEVPERPPPRPLTDGHVPATPSSATTCFLPHTHTPSRWRFFNPFHTSSAESVAASPNAAPDVRRKGDVVCLGYDTLDDRGMRRLEGRSDHRPVIGSYAVYF